MDPVVQRSAVGRRWVSGQTRTPDTIPQLCFYFLCVLRFCLDQHKLSALDRDLGLARLQSRLIRFETQTTCSKEPCPLPFALSPAPLAPVPSPAVPSEPGSVPDGESLLQLQNADVARLKRRSREEDAALGGPRKRWVCLCRARLCVCVCVFYKY